MLTHLSMLLVSLSPTRGLKIILSTIPQISHPWISFIMLLPAKKPLDSAFISNDFSISPISNIAKYIMAYNCYFQFFTYYSILKYFQFCSTLTNLQKLILWRSLTAIQAIQLLNPEISFHFSSNFRIWLYPIFLSLSAVIHAHYIIITINYSEVPELCCCSFVFTALSCNLFLNEKRLSLSFSDWCTNTQFHHDLPDKIFPISSHEIFRKKDLKFLYITKPEL